MIEFFTALKTIEKSRNTDSGTDSGTNMDNNITNFLINNVPVTWIIAAFIISFGSAYLAFKCNSNESPASRTLYTLFGFFFSGVYLIYYFIVHLMFDILYQTFYLILYDFHHSFYSFR
jgi:uncharacterized protein YybS (DUF2232 family)